MAQPKDNFGRNVAIGIGFFFLLVILCMVAFIPCPSEPQYNTFRIVLSVSVALVATVIPGTFNFKINRYLHATGSIAVLAFVYLYDPAKLNIPDNCDEFNLTIYVHGPKGKQDIILKNQGKVLVDLNGDRREERIGGKGEVHIMSIPTKFANRRVPISVVEAGIYKKADTQTTYLLSKSPIYIGVSAQGLNRIVGSVKDQFGNPIDSANIRVKEVNALTGNNGAFTLNIPTEMQQRSQQITITKQGYRVWEGTATPETSEEVKAILEKL